MSPNSREFWVQPGRYRHTMRNLLKDYFMRKELLRPPRVAFWVRES